MNPTLDPYNHRNRNMKKLISASLLLMCAACGTTPFDDMSMPMSKSYVEPSKGARARIRISTDGAVRLAVNTTCARWDDPASGVGPVAPGGGPLLTKSNTGKSLGMPGETPSGLASTELYVVAGQPIFLLYMKQRSTSLTMVAVCDGLFSFVPESGKDYQAIFRQSADGMRCQRGVIDISNRDAGIENISDRQSCKR